MAKTLAGAVYGTVDMSADEHAYISNLLKENLKTLNNQLKQKIWFCGGDKPTFADYMMVVSLAELQQCVMDTNLRNSLSNMNNLFKKVAAPCCPRRSQEMLSRAVLETLNKERSRVQEVDFLRIKAKLF